MCANCKDDLNDDLSDLLGSPMRPQPVTPPASYKPAGFTETCKKCGGSGQFYSFSSGRSLGQCFACKGRGRMTYKTSPEARATNRSNAQARNVRKQAEKRAEIEQQVEAFKLAQPDAYAWLLANVDKFEFATSLWNALRKYGSLTENQLAAVNRCIDKDTARKTERAERVASAPAISCERIEQAFASAKSKGIKRPALRLAEFTFKPAGENSKNAGAIYVTAGNDYLGKVVGGKFLRVRECTEATEAQILEVAANPEAAAVAYGKRTGYCSCCGRTLTNGESIDRGIGPICADKFGW